MSTLDETRIAALVDRFYDKVRADASIGPIFNAAVHDWAEHKELLTRFWCSVALGAHSYRGNPMAVHRGQPAIRAVHFARWLELWRETTVELAQAVHDVAAFRAHGKGFADAQDRGHIGPQSGVHLGVDERIVFRVILPALGMPGDDVTAAEFRQHRGGDLTGVGAARMGRDILGAVLDA